MILISPAICPRSLITPDESRYRTSPALALQSSGNGVYQAQPAHRRYISTRVSPIATRAGEPKMNRSWLCRLAPAAIVLATTFVPVMGAHDQNGTNSGGLHAAIRAQVVSSDP